MIAVICMCCCCCCCCWGRSHRVKASSIHQQQVYSCPSNTILGVNIRISNDILWSIYATRILAATTNINIVRLGYFSRMRGCLCFSVRWPSQTYNIAFECPLRAFHRLCPSMIWSRWIRTVVFIASCAHQWEAIKKCHSIYIHIFKYIYNIHLYGCAMEKT